MLLSVSSQGTEFDDFSLDGEFAAMDGTQFEMPVVLTAARLRQSQLDTPASVTVIESDTIAALGIKDIEEIFRLVPGMFVGYHSGVGEKAPSVSYHGTNLPEHRRLQVLIDGRSVFKPGLARVEWVDIPLAVEDIARIEVIRGPNSAAYGANSYLGIINIFTKHPETVSGNTAKVTIGGRDTQNTYLNFSQSIGNSDVRWTVGSKNKSGFDVLSDGETDHRDGLDAVYTSVRTYTPVNSRANLEFQVGYKDGTNEQRPITGSIIYETPEDIEAEDQFWWGKYTHDLSASQAFHLQLYTQKFIRTTEWQACLEDVPTYCGDLSKSMTETKSEIEYQHTSRWNTDLRTVVGARVRLDEFDSETYNGGYSDNLNYSAFMNIEYKVSDSILMNLGGMYEDDELNGDHLSPRIALNYHLTNRDTLRFIYSEAIRSPDLFEQNGQQVFTLANATIGGAPADDVVVNLGEGLGNLNNEKIYSHEVSYFGLLDRVHGQLDLKIFYDELSGLISESLGHDVVLTNSNRLVQKGVEGQLSINLNAKNRVLFGFSYIDTDDDFPSNTITRSDGSLTVEQESSLTAEKSFMFALISNVFQDWTVGSALYHIENWNVYAEPQESFSGYEFSRLDLNVNRTIRIGDAYSLNVSGVVQHRLDNDPLSRNKNNYTDDSLFYGSVQFNF